MNQIWYDLLQAPYNLLKDCTVRIEFAGGSGHGSGFFVAPGLILTCFHVIEKANNEPPKPINIFWQNQTYTAEIEKLSENSEREIDLKKVDLALLRLRGSDLNHPCVYLDESARVGDKFYNYGYTDQHKNGDPGTFEYEGFIGDTPPLLKFKAGQVRPGASGSPLLNCRTAQ